MSVAVFFDLPALISNSGLVAKFLYGVSRACAPYKQFSVQLWRVGGRRDRVRENTVDYE